MESLCEIILWNYGMGPFYGIIVESHL